MLLKYRKWPAIGKTESAKFLCYLQKYDAAKLVFSALQILGPLSLSLHFHGMFLYSVQILHTNLRWG